MRFPISFSAILALSILTSQCGGNLAPVLNETNVNVVTLATTPATTEQVRVAILEALARKSWRVLEETAGRCVASVTVGALSAKISVDYTSQTYSITHLESSEGLKFDGELIHRRYNGWIVRLRKEIDRNLHLLGARR